MCVVLKIHNYFAEDAIVWVFGEWGTHLHKIALVAQNTQLFLLVWVVILISFGLTFPNPWVVVVLVGLFQLFRDLDPHQPKKVIYNSLFTGSIVLEGIINNVELEYLYLTYLP